MKKSTIIIVAILLILSLLIFYNIGRDGNDLAPNRDNNIETNK